MNRMTGTEEQIGGFDLIYRGNPVKPTIGTIHGTNLGCFNNRSKQLKKLAKATAARLAQDNSMSFSSNTSQASVATGNTKGFKSIH